MGSLGSDKGLAIRRFAPHKGAPTVSEIADTLQLN
jgi:hypothetical protein